MECPPTGRIQSSNVVSGGLIERVELVRSTAGGVDLILDHWTTHEAPNQDEWPMIFGKSATGVCACVRLSRLYGKA